MDWCETILGFFTTFPITHLHLPGLHLRQMHTPTRIISTTRARKVAADAGITTANKCRSFVTAVDVTVVEVMVDTPSSPSEVKPDVEGGTDELSSV